MLPQEKLSELVYLEWDELLALLNKDFGKKNYLARVRDVLCFCCFSSLRYSDVSRLRKTDIRDGYFLIATEKTVDPLAIDLNNFSQAILNKYKDIELSEGLALPVISHQKMNDYLKEIGEIMKFNSPVKGNTLLETNPRRRFIRKRTYSQRMLEEEHLSLTLFA